ncbi:tRNA (guanine-N(7)-)-methyltransferase [Thiovulum sp. ES]|nr:tRNA (guanine-N(7)-)-methyltransferase [Thiovulum sp. ES]
MPHIFIKDFDKKKFKDKIDSDEVSFHFIGKSLRWGENYSVLTSFRNIDMFLSIQKRDEKWLVKGDKNTRPSPNFPLHKAIETFGKFTKSEILFSNLNLKESQHIPQNSKLKTPQFFEEDFWKVKKNRVQIEIGFGSGRHILHRAKNEPDSFFIGVEIHKPSIEQVLKQIEIQGLKNIYLLDFDARLFLETLPSNSIDTIYVHFPVPWDKRPHRRVINPQFIVESKRVLKHLGILELRTDSENYFQWSLDLFLKEEKLKMELLKNQQIDITSKYEDRWIKLEKNIYNFRITNLDKSDSLRLVEELPLFYHRKREDFSEIKNLIGTKILRENWFISFVDIFEISETEFVFQIVGGSYNYPETRFLFTDSNKIEYLIRKPLEIEVNREIDKHLRELL